jgi:hypothetical protein
MRRCLGGMSRRNIFGLATTLIVHALALIYLTVPVTPERSTQIEPHQTSNDRALVLRFFARPPGSSKPAPPAVVKPSPSHRHNPASNGKAMRVQTAPTAPVPSNGSSSELAGAHLPGKLNIYSRDGSIVVPVKPVSFGKDRVVNLDIKSPVPCHQTSLAAKWDRGQDEDVGARVARKYLRWVGLYNRAVETGYQRRAAEHKENCQSR